MKALLKIFTLVVLGFLSTSTLLNAQKHEMMSEDHLMVLPSELVWSEGPGSLPPGAKFTVIEGVPSEAGLFTMRLKLPANYVIGVHTHPAHEHVTVLEGACYMGVGKVFDEKAAKELKTGAFALMKIGTYHYFFTKEECVVQLHGMGPWGINYLDPKDDPRIKAVAEN
jgi:quercetin dioxygenase-like cupin family protein